MKSWHPSRWFVVPAIALALAVIAAVFLRTKFRSARPDLLTTLPGMTGLGLTPGVTFSKLDGTPQFRAVFEGVTTGSTSRAVGPDIPWPPDNASRLEYIIVHLRRDGGPFVILVEHPTQNDAAFVNSLRKGEQYTFPDVHRAWQRAHE